MKQFAVTSKDNDNADSYMVLIINANDIEDAKSVLSKRMPDLSPDDFLFSEVDKDKYGIAFWQIINNDDAVEALLGNLKREVDDLKNLVKTNQ